MSIPLQDLTKTGTTVTSNPAPASQQDLPPANNDGPNPGGTGVLGPGPGHRSGSGVGSPGVGPVMDMPGWRFALLGLG